MSAPRHILRTWYTGAWQKVQDRVNKINAMSKAQIKEEATSIVAAVLAKAKATVTLDQVTRATRKPEPYSKPCQNTVQEVRFWNSCVSQTLFQPAMLQNMPRILPLGGMLHWRGQHHFMYTEEGCTIAFGSCVIIVVHKP